MENKKWLINASAYCKELYEERDYPGRTQEFMDAIEVAIADLCDMPTVDAVEVVHARWKLDRYATEWTCSNCEGEMLYKVTAYGGGQYHDLDNIFPPYCPHCGAKMDEEEPKNE